VKLFVVVFGFLLSQASFATSIRPLIINGEDVKDKKIIAATVGIQDDKTFCTGSYIGNRKVVTAAHCLEHGEVPVKFLSGVENAEPIEVFVEKQVAHPDFKDLESTPGVDIAVITLKEDQTIDFEKWPQYDLPSAETKIEVGEVIQVGYGVAMPDGCGFFGCGPTFPNLYQIIPKALYKSDFVGMPEYKKAIEEGRTTCYKTTDEGGVFYIGDSGGPSLLTSQKNPVLVGVHSIVLISSENSSKFLGSCDTVVAPLVEWIREQ